MFENQYFMCQMFAFITALHYFGRGMHHLDKKFFRDNIVENNI